MTFVRFFEDSLKKLCAEIADVVIMATDKKDWQEVDPRVEWAMKILDWGEVEPNNMFTYLATPVFGGVVLGSTMFVRNYFYARPMWAGAPFTLAIGVAGFFGAKTWRDWKAGRQQVSECFSQEQSYPYRKKFITCLENISLSYPLSGRTRTALLSTTS